VYPDGQIFVYKFTQIQMAEGNTTPEQPKPLTPLVCK